MGRASGRLSPAAGQTTSSGGAGFGATPTSFTSLSTTDLRVVVGRGRIELPQPKARVLQTLGLTTCPTDPSPGDRRAAPRVGDAGRGRGGDEGTRTPDPRDANAVL